MQLHNICLGCGHRKDEHSSDGSRCHNDYCHCLYFKQHSCNTARAQLFKTDDLVPSPPVNLLYHMYPNYYHYNNTVGNSGM